MIDDPHSALKSNLSAIGPYLPQIARVDRLPAGTPKGTAGHDAVYEYVFGLLFHEAPRTPASKSAPLCAEDYALSLLYMALKWPGLQVFGHLDLAEGESGGRVVRVPPQYRPPAPVFRSLARMLPLDPDSRVCFSNGRLCFAQPVDPSVGDRNELLLVFYDEAKAATLYWAEIID